MKIDRNAIKNQEQGVSALKGVIKSDRSPGECTWQKIEGRIYVTCMGCSAINDISSFRIISSGSVYPCTTCANCCTHYWLRLQDWDGSESFCCDSCGRIERTRGGLPKGWGRSYGAYSALCPKCS